MPKRSKRQTTRTVPKAKCTERDRSKLTGNQERFAQWYAHSLNKSGAYKAAGYKYEKLSPHQIVGAADRLLATPKVRARVDILQSRAAKVLDIRSNEILHRMAAIALSDPADIFDDDWNVKKLSQMPAHARFAIASVDTRTMGEGKMLTTVKLEPRTPMLRLLSEILKMAEQKKPDANVSYNLQVNHNY